MGEGTWLLVEARIHALHQVEPWRVGRENLVVNETRKAVTDRYVLALGRIADRFQVLLVEAGRIAEAGLRIALEEIELVLLRVLDLLCELKPIALATTLGQVDQVEIRLRIREAADVAAREAESLERGELLGGEFEEEAAPLFGARCVVRRDLVKFVADDAAGHLPFVE